MMHAAALIAAGLCVRAANAGLPLLFGSIDIETGAAYHKQQHGNDHKICHGMFSYFSYPLLTVGVRDQLTALPSN